MLMLKEESLLSFSLGNPKAHFWIYFFLNLTKLPFSSLHRQVTTLPVIFSHLFFKIPRTVMSLTFSSPGISWDRSRTSVEFWSDCEMTAHFSGRHFRLTSEPKPGNGYYPTFIPLKSNTVCRRPCNHSKSTISLFCTTNNVCETI